MYLPLQGPPILLSPMSLADRRFEANLPDLSAPAGRTMETNLSVRTGRVT